MVNPVPGRGITTPYGKPGGWSGGRHGGADWAAPTGTTVVAAWSGTVTGASWGSSYGTQVVIDQDRLPNGSAGLWAVYAHLSRKSVSPGQRVTAGQKIGEVGSTGNATGPHLHYEVQRAATWRSGNHVNPQPWIDSGTTPAPPPVPEEPDEEKEEDTMKPWAITLKGRGVYVSDLATYAIGLSDPNLLREGLENGAYQQFAGGKEMGKHWSDLIDKLR